MRIMMSNVRALKPVATPSGYKVLAKGEDRAEIYLYGIIGQDWFGNGVSAKQFADDLKKLKNVKTIDVRINSEGGDVFAGKAMYSLLVEHKAKIVVHVDGLAASAASFIAMAGDSIEISEGAFVMIHNAWTWSMGGADDMRRTADLLDTVNATIRDVYIARTKNSEKQVKAWMDDETWFTGKEAKEAGFADVLVENLKVAACISDPKHAAHLPAAKFKKMPAALLPRRAAALAQLEALKR